MRAKTLIQSVDRAIEILEIVRDADGPVRAAMIAHEMELPLKTAHNLIRSLLQHGYLVQNEEKSYQLGPECFLLADQAKGPFSQLGRQVGDAVLELHRKSGMAAFFGNRLIGNFKISDGTFSNSEIGIYNLLIGMLDDAEATVQASRTQTRKLLTKSEMERYEKAYAAYLSVFQKLDPKNPSFMPEM